MRGIFDGILLSMFEFLFRTRRVRVTNKGPNRDYLALKEHARELVHARLAHFNQHYNFSYNRVSIKNTKTKWGSCSSKRNLNFSYKIITLPPELQDYLIVHELCHLSEMNHRKGFWDLVGETIPNPIALHTKLRYNEFHGKTIKPGYQKQDVAF
jgi:predicted metal-dependent hydrolase